METNQLLYIILGCVLIMMSLLFYSITIIKKIHLFYSEKVHHIEAWVVLADGRLSKAEKSIETHEIRFDNLHQRIVSIENMKSAL